MSLWKIAWRSIEQRGLASTLTGMSMALGVMLVVAVIVIHGVINESFLNNSSLGYNVLVGAKGGRLELVLNSVYYLSRPVENIPYNFYQEFVDGKYKAYVDKAIPLCLGDMYKDFRVVGTTPAFFDQLDYGGHKYEFAEGRNFRQDEFFGAVIGSTVALQTDLKEGDEFQPSHGVGPDAHVHDPFKVVGVLKPTGTPNDRALFINMEGFYLIPDHQLSDEQVAAHAEEHEHEEGHEHDKDADHEHGDHEHADEAADHEHGDSDHEHGEHAHADNEEKASEAPGEEGHEHAHEEGEEHEDEHAAEGEDHEHADGEHEHGDHDHADHEDADHEHAEHAHEHGEHAHEHGHDEHGHHHHEPLPAEKREVTSILVLTASFNGLPPELMAPDLMNNINEGSVAQAVQPIREMNTLFDTFVNPLRILLLSLTVMIVIVSGIGILVSIYNSMSERQHEIAVMRALGAGRQTVMVLVLLESILLSLAGGLAGWIIGHGLIAALSPWIALKTGVSLGFLQFVGYELVIIPGLIVLAAIVGYLPALAAYRTDVAKALSATP